MQTPLTVRFPAVEEMNCPTCECVTGHVCENSAWTCVHCKTKLVASKKIFSKILDKLKNF